MSSNRGDALTLHHDVRVAESEKVFRDSKCAKCGKRVSGHLAKVEHAVVWHGLLAVRRPAGNVVFLFETTLRQARKSVPAVSRSKIARSKTSTIRRVQGYLPACLAKRVPFFGRILEKYHRLPDEVMVFDRIVLCVVTSRYQDARNGDTGTHCPVVILRLSA
ncbi:hypothetical protein PYCC9005_003907 [Savitreella phatthalungensis]